MSAAPRVKGWCPGALSPMPTGDGLLARVRPSAGRLSLDQAEGLAECASAFGNGAIELTSRANFQLRGVREIALPDLQARLARLGLIDDHPAVERARNIIASPLGDLDPEARDVAPLVAALEARIASDKIFHDLPAKFGFVIDGGGRFPLGDVDADVRFEAMGAGWVVSIGEAGSPHPQPLPVKNGEGSGSPPRSCGEGLGVGRALAADDLPETASRLARAFLAFAHPPRRMRDLTGRVGARAVFTAAGLAPVVATESPRAIAPRAIAGLLLFPGQTALGVAVPLGRTDARALAALVAAARDRSASGLRLTPWRALVVIGGETKALACDLTALGFIVTPHDPRLGVVACPGAPACEHGERDAPSDALAFARGLPNTGGVALHVSGCAKGCARAAATPIMLTATPDGYDLILDGRAGDPPMRRGLSVEQAAEAVRGLAA